MASTLRCSFLTLLLIVFAVRAHAQTLGTPPFGTYGGGPDVINLSNLNSHITVPVFHKPGRGLAFDFNLTYDSSIWSSTFVGSTTTWQPRTNWGWGNGGTDIGVVTFSVTVSTITCVINGHLFSAQRTLWKNWVYYDGSGTPHTFNGTAKGTQAQCSSSGNDETVGFSSTANDGSGYTLSVTGNCCAIALKTIQVVPLNGNIITPGSQSGGPGKIQDTNGNLITTDTSGHITDTLGIVAMTTAGAAPNPVTHTYTAPSGVPATFITTYRTYTVQTNFGCSGIAEYGPTSNSLVDRITLPDGSFYQFNYEPTPGFATNVTGRLASITFPTGGTISYLYTGGNQGIECSDGTTAGLTRTTPDGVWSYSRSLGTFPNSTTTITDPLANQTVMQFIYVYQTVEQIYQGSISPANLLRTTSTCYDGITTNCATTFFGIPISQRAVTIQLGSNGPQCKHVTFYDGGPGTLNTGVITEQDDYNYGSGSVGPLAKKTIYTYGPWQDGTSTKLQTVTIRDGAGTLISQTTFGYDETAPIATSGLPQHVSIPVSKSRRNLTSQTLVGHWTYFDTGNLATATDLNNHSTTYTYSSTFAGAYPTTIANALSQSVTMNYDPNIGLLTSSTDLNGRSTTFSYDNMLRPLQANYPDGGQKSTAYQTSSFPFSTTTTRKITSSLSYSSKIILDGLGRAAQSQLTSDPSGTVYTVSTLDTLGRLARAYNPTRCNPPTTSCGESTWGYTSYTYDALGRVTSITAPDGASTATSYSFNSATTTDPAGKTRKSVSDAFGRVTQVLEDPVGLNYETDYTYDVLGNLLTVMQKGGSASSAQWRTRTFTYDSLSHLLTANNPESGTSTYTYDSAGNLLTKTSPKQNQSGTATVTTTYSYDALNRLTQRSYNDGITPTVKFGYDAVAPTGCTPPALTVTNGIGRRTSMCDAAGAEAWSYDTVGRPLADQRTTNSVTKATTYTYNLDGSVASLAYPSGRVIVYTPSAAGRTISAADSTGPINYATAALYSAAGALSSFTNGASTVSSYFYNNRLQPCRISIKNAGAAPTSCTDVTTGNVLDFTYNFSLGASDNGNVTGITNNRDTTRSQSFTYDSLNRIATAKTSSTSGTTCWDEAFSYDPWGNLLSIGRISGYTCSNEELLNVAATTKNQISGNTYDAAGNLIAIPSIASYTYDAENHLKTAAGVTYTYDGAGNRVQKSSGKLYWYGMGSDPLDETDLAGNTNNASFNEYIFFVGKRIARRDSTNAVNYNFADHLGTARIVTNASGSVCYDADFYPFGGERSITSTCSQNYKFTSKERDGESGLDNFGARFDSSSLGRFTSPDPSMDSVKLRNPQSWNRYTYTINNPLRFVDPDGELWVASGVANDPYKWVDECEDGNVCYEAVAAAIGSSLRIYGSDSSGDVTNFQANENGMVDLNDINQQHDAAFDVNSKTQYSYVAVKMGADFFNFVQDYQTNYPNDAPNLYVTEAGSEDGSKVPGHYTHRDGLQIDLRYADDSGRNIWGGEAYNKADADRMWDLFRMAGNNGMTQIYAGDESEWGDFAKRPNPPYDPHESHFHLSIPNPRPPRN